MPRKRTASIPIIISFVALFTITALHFMQPTVYGLPHVQMVIG